MKKAATSLKKAYAGCKEYHEADMIESYIKDIQRITSCLEDDLQSMQDDADALQLGIFNYQAKEANDGDD